MILPPALAYTAGNAPTAGALQAYLNSIAILSGPDVAGNVKCRPAVDRSLIYGTALANRDTGL